MSTFIINNIFFSSCSHTPPSDYGVADIIGNIGQYILIYGLGTFADGLAETLLRPRNKVQTPTIRHLDLLSPRAKFDGNGDSRSIT